jgi:serine/threonine protein kinase
MYDDIDPRNLPIGTVVDGYTLTARLGGGGMGEIYRAQRGSEVFALKLQGERLTEAMDPAKREELDARSRREAAVLLSLSHPNILAIIGSGRWPDRGGYLYLITELVPGEALDAWHRSKQPSLRELTRVFERVADALDYMHRLGIYHRDLKDPNVLVREDGSPVVIDLGIARSAAAYTLTQVGAVIGTTTHLSPGVCRYLVGDKSHTYHFGANDDLHALGFMLYERLTGTSPFRQRMDVEWPEFDYYHQVMEHVPPAPIALCPKVPDVLSALTMRLLAKTQEANYRDAKELQEALENALSSAASSAWDEPYAVPRGVPRKDLTRSGPSRLPLPNAKLGAVARVDARNKRAANPPPPPPLSSLSADGGPKKEPVGKTERAIAALATHQSDAAAAAPCAFHPPTREGALGFVPPDDVSKQAPTVRRDALSDTSLRWVLEKVRPETRRRRRVGTLGLLLLGTGVLVLAGLVAKSVAERVRPQPKSLLQRYQEELRAERGRDEPATGASGVEAVSALPVQIPSAQSGLSAAAASSGARAISPAGDRSPPSQSDAKAIQTELERNYSGKRPVLPGKVLTPGPAMPSWVKGVEVVDTKPLVVGETKLGGRYGDHLRLRLRSNLDSRLCGSGAVEALLLRPYLVDGKVVLPTRTLAYGQCTAQGGRFLVSLNRLRLPDGTEARFDGAAMDVVDGKPGLLANRRLALGNANQESTGGAIARGAASTVLSAATAGGNVGGQVASGAGQTALSSNGALAPSAGGEDAILLDAGGEFDVFLRQSF